MSKSESVDAASMHPIVPRPFPLYGSCCCGNPSGTNVNDCERCLIIARLQYCETLMYYFAVEIAENDICHDLMKMMAEELRDSDLERWAIETKPIEIPERLKDAKAVFERMIAKSKEIGRAAEESQRITSEDLRFRIDC